MDYKPRSDSVDVMDISTSTSTDIEDQFDDSLEMDDDDDTSPSPPLVLPKRFRPKKYNKYNMTYTTLQAESSLEELTIGVVIEPEMNDDVIVETDDESGADRDDCTGDDVSQALSWIRHQLMALKQEDKNILERFYEIRAKMNKFRNNLYKSILPIHASANHSSASDPSIPNSQSDNYHFRASSLNDDCYLGQFRDRTVSMLPPRTDLTLLVPPDNDDRRKVHELV